MHLFSLRVIAAAAVCAGVAAAQTPDPKPRLFSFGARANYLLRTTFRPAPVATPPNNSTLIDQGVTTGFLKLSYGLTAEISFSRKWSMTLDGLYRQIGYDSAVITSTITRDTGEFQRVRATAWTIPVMLRYYPAGRIGAGRPFVFGGYAYQKISRHRPFSETILSDVVATTQGTASALARKSVGGLIAGAGLLFTDDFGIKVSPEARYTRWVKPVFESSVVRMRADQLEVGLSLTF